MKQIFLFLILLLSTSFLSFSQDRGWARGAEPGELYISGGWYGIYLPGLGPPYYDTLYSAIYHLTEHGKKIAIQYNVEVVAIELHQPPLQPDSVLIPGSILADATPGVVYTRCFYGDTFLWVSFDYGKNWIFREKIIDKNRYYAVNLEGIIYRYGYAGYYKSTDYGQNFYLTDEIVSSEPGLQEGEAYSVSANVPYQGRLLHTYNFSETYTIIPIDSQFVYVDPNVYRGGLPGEVYVSSYFKVPNGRINKVSFSADTGHTFRHVYVSEIYNPQVIENPFLFMSDREPGVFYIIRCYNVYDYNPDGVLIGEHAKFCIEYYRDYGEILEATFCHDLTKDYEYQEVICEHTTSLHAEVNHNSVQLQWLNAAEEIRGYHVFRNNVRITNVMLTEPTYLDENLHSGNYEYYIRTYYVEGCVSDTSNHVTETIEICEPVNNLTSEKCNENCVLLTWSEPESSLPVAGYQVFRNNELLNQELITDSSYLDNHLPSGNYEYYVVAHYANGCVSDSSNHVRETVEVGVKDIKDFEDIILYPNPTNEKLHVTCHSSLVTNVEIFDVYGRNILHSPFSILHSIDVSGLQAGIYFVRIATEKGVVMRKVVKY